MQRTGIYKITNTINNKIYIGRSIDMRMRWFAHKRNYLVRNSILYQDMRKYGVENFHFEILEKCNIEKLDERERYWIKKLDTHTKGYNMTTGTSERTSECILEDIKTLLIDNKEITLKKIAKCFDISIPTILAVNNGNLCFDSNEEYPIRIFKAHNYKTQCYCGKIIDINFDYCNNCYQKSNHNKRRPNREIFKDLIRYKPFLEVGRIYGITDNAIRKWCVYYKLPRTKKDINKYSNEEWELL